MKKLTLTALAVASMNVGYAQKLNLTDTIMTLSTVEVTGRKIEKVNLLGMDIPLKNLPMTVTKIDEKLLDKKNIINIEDAVKFLPGVTVSNQYGAFQKLSIRGNSDAVVTVNGVRDERSLITSTPYDNLNGVESIEVVKGPASILSGHSAMGGVINIVQKKPTGQFKAKAKLSYGSWNQKQSSIAFGGKLVGPVNYQANIFYSTGDGYRNVGADRFSGLFSLSSAIGRNGYLEASANFTDDDYRTEIGSAPTMPGDVFVVDGNKAFANKGERNPMADYHTTYNDLSNNNMHVKNADFTLKYTHKVADWMTIREQASYGHRDLDYSAVEYMSYRTSKEPIYDWYYMKNGTKTYIELDSLQSGTPLCFNPDSRSFANTLESSGKFYWGNITHSYTLGWSYSYFDYTQYNGYNKDDVWGPGVNQMLALRDPYTVRDWWDSKVSAVNISRYNTNGIYFNNVFDISEQWKAMVGIRYDLHNYKRARATIDDGRQHYDRENRTDWNKVNASAFSYRAGVVYYPIPSLSLYASAASSFRPNIYTYSPNVIYINKNGNEFFPTEDSGKIFDPEKGFQGEFGLRYELDDKLEVNASVFIMNKNNIVRYLGTKEVEEEGVITNKSIRGQIGRARSKGFDLSITYRPLPNLQFAGGWGWSDYRYTKPSSDTSEWNFTEAVNLRATGTPRTTAFAYVDYEIRKGILKDLSLNLTATYTDKIYRNVTNNIYLPSRLLVDAGIYYAVNKHINLSFVANNIFNKEYFEKQTIYGKPANFMASIAFQL